jgi:hypothetical protein
MRLQTLLQQKISFDIQMGVNELLWESRLVEDERHSTDIKFF